MRFSILIIQSVLLLYSCSQADSPSAVSKSKESELRTYFTEIYKDIDSTVTIDTFRFVRLDTITQQVKYRTTAFSLLEKYEDLTEDLKRINDLAENSLQMLRLTRGLSEELYENAKEEGQKYIEQGKEKSLEMEGVKSKYDSLMELSKKADSTAPVGYQAVCLYQVRLRSQAVKKDTAYITLNSEKNIVERDDFYKY